MDQIVVFSDDVGMDAAIQRQLLLPLDTNGLVPLWRLLVLADNTVILSFHHCIGDGKSGTAFHAALVQALNDPAIFREPSTHVEVPKLDLIPPVEAVVDCSVTSSPAAWTQPSTAWSANRMIDSPTRRVLYGLIHFSADENGRFLAACRKNQSTITSGIHTLSTSIVARLVSEGEAEKGTYTTIASTVPVSLRGLGHAAPDVMCNYVSSCHLSTPIEQTQFSWTNAAALAIQLKSEALKCPESVGLLKYMGGKERGFLKSLDGKKRRAGIETSNIGRFDLSTGPEGKWKLTRIVMAQCDPVAGSAIKVTVTGEPDGGLSLAVTYGDESIDSQFVESFMREFRKEFLELIGSSKA